MFNFSKQGKSILTLDPMTIECGGCKCISWGGTSNDGSGYNNSTVGTKESSNATSQPQPWGINGDVAE